MRFTTHLVVAAAAGALTATVYVWARIEWRHRQARPVAAPWLTEVVS